MSSWTLLRHLFGLVDSDNPLFLRETLHPPIWHGLYTRLTQATGTLLVMGGLGCYSAVLMIYMLHSLLGMLVPVLLLWALLVGLTLGPVVVGERSSGTWDMLRTTPMPLERLLLGKAGGTLWWLHDFTRLIGGLMALAAFGLGLMTLIVIATARIVPLTNGWVLCGLVLFVPIVSGIVFLFDRGQVFVLIASGALAVSASSRSLRSALAASSAAAALVLLADASIAGFVIALQPNTAALASPGDAALLLTLGPAAGYLTRLPPERALPLIVGTLLLREIAVRGLWRWTIRLAADE